MAKGVKTGGRVKGTPNKVDKEFRETIAALLSDNADNVAIWLAQVATGSHGKEPAPEKALDLLTRLAEYAAPKLSRTEVSNPEGETFKTESTWVVQPVKPANEL